MIKLKSLNQFDKRLFNKFFGNYVKNSRLQVGYSLEQLSQKIQSIDVKNLKLIECGRARLDQDDLDLLCIHLQLDHQELLNIARMIQVQSLLGIYEEINSNYP